MTSHGYVLDVSAYQPQAAYYDFWANWKAKGVKGAIVKLSEGTSWTSTYGAGQIAAAQHEGLKVSGYHFSRFRGNSYQAVTEANLAISCAHQMGLPQGSPLVLDYEERLGDRGSNTQAAIAFLKCIKAAGFTPCFYSYSGMANLWDFNAIHQATGAVLWIAAYPKGSQATTEPLMGYFPSLSDYTAAWQFTDNFAGAGLDGSVDLTGFFTDGVAQKPTSGGSLDSATFEGGNLKLSGWFTSNDSKGKPYAYVILTDEAVKHEFGRVKVAVTDRPDVAKVYPDIFNSGHSGFNAVVKYSSAIAGQKVRVIFRYTDDPAGNGTATDFSQVIDLSKSDAYLDLLSTITFTKKLRASGWFASDLSVGREHAWLILYDVDKKQEVQRVAYTPSDRPDVEKAQPAIYGAGKSGFVGEFDYGSSLVGRNLQLIARYAKAKDGNSDYVDYWFPPFVGPAMPVLDGKTESEILVHSFTANEVENGLIKLTFK